MVIRTSERLLSVKADGQNLGQLFGPQQGPWKEERPGGWMIYLYWLASATSYRVTSKAFDVHITTVYNVDHQTAGAIISIMGRAVCLLLSS